MKTFIIPMASALALASSLTTTQAMADPIVVGSKNFSEQYILAEIYAELLENAGYEVERKINLGGTLIAHQAITSGGIDLYPEYTGTALTSVVHGTLSTDAQEVYEEVSDYYADKLNLRWLKPTGINNGYVIIMRDETAKKDGLESLSDLASVAGDMVFGGGPEFPERADGLPGLERVYGATFKEFRQFTNLGLRYDALNQGDIDVSNGYATDWQLDSGDLKVLNDDKGLFPPYYVAPVVRQEVLDAHPDIQEILESVGSHLDNSIMRRLNAKFERDHEEPADIVADFLHQEGLVD
ncbi:glycine betaine ABC transporter substrate-binding protein [Salinicola salarius]|uniref:glycine betaine ABC transporter substrate-binding protein n=1 Tax=Salinicola salarius TaxID=430457 RepID=UPI0023E42BCB|nr:glycine betaine ABC transporter substrate-binding protein [Salinicola salarius]MDF3917835.1 glycine betaine ABC transporter substrate-binding protein [Salinicola salarius]